MATIVLPTKKSPTSSIPPRSRKIAKVGDIILWKKTNLKMEVIRVRENSVIAQHCVFPVVGREQEFEWDNTVINHKNYHILQSKEEQSDE